MTLATVDRESIVNPQSLAVDACPACESRCLSMCICHLSEAEQSRFTGSLCNCGQCRPCDSYCPNAGSSGNQADLASNVVDLFRERGK